jgi:predicted outer membrane repeat protein
LIETNSDLTLVGVTIQGGISAATANAGGTGGGIRAVNKSSPIVLTLRNSTVTGNSAQSNSSYGGYGGGIYSRGATVVVENSTISGNSAYFGGGIDAGSGNVVLTGSTVSGNRADNGYGGGIRTTGDATLSNCTFSGNYASTGGGGILAHSIDMSFCTFSGNTTLAGQAGGGILIQANSTGSANLMVGNDPGNDVDGTQYSVSFTGNFNSIHTVGHNATISGSSNKTGASACSAPAALGDNGGPTQTMALVPGTNDCAIDHGPTSSSGLTSDQRGPLFERRSGSATDIGAFEYQPANDRIFYNGFEK